MADYNALAVEVIKAKARKKRAEDELKAANAALEAVERTLWNTFVDNDVDKVSVNGFPFSPDLKTYYSIPADNAEAVRSVMEKLGLGELYKLTVNAQTFQAAMRDLAERSGGDLPPELDELVTSFPKEKINGPGYDKCVAWVEAHGEEAS